MVVPDAMAPDPLVGSPRCRGTRFSCVSYAAPATQVPNSATATAFTVIFHQSR